MILGILYDRTADNSCVIKIKLMLFAINSSTNSLIQAKF